MFRRSKPTPPLRADIAANTATYSWVSQQDATATLGGTATFTNFRPHLMDPGDHSLNEVLVTNGTATVEVGWNVDPNLYGDDVPHLFVYTTPDGYRTGGYNAKSAFIWAGGPLPGSAVPMGLRQTYGITQYQGNWWIKYNDQWIGYVPNSAVAGMATSSRTLVYAEVNNAAGKTSQMLGNISWAGSLSNAYVSTGYKMYDQSATGMVAFGGA